MLKYHYTYTLKDDRKISCVVSVPCPNEQDLVDFHKHMHFMLQQKGCVLGMTYEK